MDQQKRFFVAMALYAGLAIAIWLTMDNVVVPMEVPLGDTSFVQIKLRSVVLGILAIFGVLTVLRWKIDQRRAQKELSNTQRELAVEQGRE
jgi:hypothetical protein